VWKRVQQDLDQSIQSRYGNILKANEGFLEAVAYDIPGLRLRSSPGIKLDPVASLREYGLVGLFRAVAMNSATGGWSRRFAAPHWALQLRDVLLSRPVVRFTGPEQPHFTNKLNLIFRDETEFLRRRGYLPAPTHIITNTMATAAAAIRSHSPTWTPFLRWMKAIPAEELALRIGSMWSADAGRALIEHRNILSQMYPFQTLPDGSVDGSGVPLWLGPSLDFWRWLLEHILFWLHLLWMGRLLFFTRPLIISGWGTTMFYIIQRNLLSHVWNYIPDNARTLLLSGQTPDNILDLLPTASHEKWYPEADGGEFLDAVGTLLIVSCGLDDRVLSLYVPQLHPGAAKYTPKEAPLMEKISYCTELINAVAVEEVEVHRLRGVVPCHENVEASWTYMQALRNAIEDRIVSSGLRAKLDDLKTELGQIQATDRHFRTLLKSTQFVPRGPQGRPVIFKLAARADQRRQQFEHLIAISVVNARGGLDPDPFSLVPRPWKDSIGCDDHLAWFLSLKEGTSISHSARNFANSLESYERVLDNQKAIGVWRRTKAVQDRIGTTKDLQALSSAMQDLQDPRGKAVRPLNRSFRCATCRTCGRIVVGHNDKSVHTCNDQEHTLTAKNFPDLDRLLYPHDILSRPDLLNLFALADEPFMDIINRLQSQFGLSEHSASSIFAQPSTRSFLRDTLHPADVAAVERLAAAMSGDTIYVSVTEPALQMAPTIAVDWVLRQKHNLPTVLEAQMASSRRAWEDRNTTDLFEWLAKDSKR
jgi:hypothetical protein